MSGREYPDDRVSEHDVSTGTWFVWAWSDGLTVYAVFDNELAAYRWAQAEGYGCGEKVGWAEWGQRFEDAVKTPPQREGA